MIGVFTWVRSSWRWVLPVQFVVQTISMLTEQGSEQTSLPGWALDWSWMLSVLAGSTLLLSPVSAGACVLLVHRGWGVEARELAWTARRGGRAVFDIAAAVAVQGFAVQLSWLAIGSACCWAAHGDARGVTLPWQLLTGPAALAASCLLGVFLACVWSDPWAIPVVPVALFWSQNLTLYGGYPELFETESAGIAMTGYRPIPAHLAATVAANAGAALALGSLLAWLARPRRMRTAWWFTGALIGAAVVVACFWPFVAAEVLDTYEEIP